MICPNCATENRIGAKFCSECATPLASGCPSCGTINPPAAKFCSECATPLQAGVRPAAARAAVPAPANAPAQGSGANATGPVAERRVVSILFADLVGFTTYSEGRDAEEVRGLLSKYFELASALIGRYGGTVEKFIGDAVMAVWGAPVAREDDAERAVRAGLDLVDAVTKLAPGIQARAGVLTGEAAVTIGATNQGMVAGDLVNTASRLQSAAAPGMVLVGEATQRAAASAILFEEAGEQTMKGKSAPVAAWRAVRVVAERGGRNRSETLEAPFVGRDDELRLLKDLFHATEREGKSRLVSVIGPAGIGKTRLSWEFLKYVDGLLDNVWWHTGRCPAYGDGITFWALGEMVRGRAGLAETDDEATTRERIAATVAQHVADEAEARWIESALLALLGISGAQSIGSDQLFAAWRTFFERMASTSPVVMVFEDMHHADRGLLDFVDHLMEWARTSPIIVITLSRPDLVERRPDWGVGLRAFTSIYLEPLPPADMQLLLGGLVPGLPKASIDRIVARADGIPLYAVETVRMLLAQGRLVKDGESYRPTGAFEEGDLAVPETLSALIAARLDGLDAADRALVEDAAVVGQSFTVAGVAAVAGLTAQEIEPRLRGLVRRELLILDDNPRSPERGQYQFVQALIREVAYNTLSRKDRKVRHLAAARYFESLATEELVGGMAQHYLAAQQLAADVEEAAALAAQARIALRGAADRAASLGSFGEARTFYEQALEVTTDPADRAELHTRASEAALQGIDPEPIMRHLEAAVAERRRTSDREQICFAVAALALQTTGVMTDPAAGLAMALAAWEEFSDLEQTRAGVELMSVIGRSYHGLNEAGKALEWVERYLPIAERLGDLEQITRGIQRKGTSLCNTGRPREGIVLLRGAHQLALANDFGQLEEGCRVLLTFFDQWGDPAGGLALGREGLEIGRKRGSRQYQFLMVGNTSWCATRVGEWDWAVPLLDEWVDSEMLDQYRFEFVIVRAVIRALRGIDTTAELHDAAGMLEGVTDPQYLSYLAHARAVNALARGDFATAVREAEDAPTHADYFSPLSLPVAARAALWAGDAGAASRLLATDRESGFWGSALEIDRSRTAAGIAALEGRTGAALPAFLEAIRAYEALGLPFEAAAAAVDMAVTLPDAASSAAAAAAIATARETLTRLGAQPFLDRLDAASATGNSGAAASPARASAAARAGVAG
ncbi:MAG TPA: adenylate/guanylate cyclase domain-containing protein [Candidatus Limnocylindrales bacterium]|nr:adenylate/guanylate cyclase domain-containing protein [Candidatus Limnocylindrales bacterium]